MTISQRLRSMSGPMSPKQLAPIIGKHYQTVYQDLRQGRIPHRRDGGRIKIDPERAAEWWEKGEIAP